MFSFKCTLVLCAAVAAHGFSLGPTDIVFHLYTRNNPTLSQALLPSVASIMSSSLDSSLPTVFTIHSYNSSVSGNFNAFVTRAHFATENVNIIAVDWSRGASSYTFGLSNIPQVGNVIAQFINILNDNFGYSPDNIRIVGHGLGAHAAGIAARAVKGTVPLIIGLDPSLPGWTHHPGKLSKDAARVVEVLHTTAGVYGYDKPLGHIDFYANGGVSQIGCGSVISCSHTFAYIFYAESITAESNNGNKFIGTACDSYENATAIQCSGARDATFGGTGNKTGASGIYVFLTNASQPFARG